MVADDYGDYYQIPQALVLMPSVCLLPAWNIRFDELKLFATRNTQLTDALIAAFFQKQVWGKTRYSVQAITQILRPVTALINYIITDRLVRALRFLRHPESRDFVLPKVPDYVPRARWKELNAFARESWEYNQFLLNELLRGRADILHFAHADHGEAESYAHFHPNYGFAKGVTSQRNPLPVRIFNAIANPARTLAYVGDTIDRWWPVENPVLVNCLTYNTKELRREGFFAPRGRFKDVGHIDLLPPTTGIDTATRDQMTRIAQPDLTACYREFMRHFVELTTEDEPILDNAAHLFFKLVPTSFLEQLNDNCHHIYRTFAAYGGRHYLSGVFSGDSAFFNFAATQLGKTIWGIQHGTHGGYLANGVCIAEESISGCDSYVTSGWTNEEPHLPLAKRGLTPLSSPHYSSLAQRQRERTGLRASVPDSVSATPAHRVLLCLGEVYRFPVFYDNFLKPDTLKHWSCHIEDVIRSLTSHKITVVLKLYSPAVARRVRPALDAWKCAGGEFLTVLDNPAKGEAQRLFDNVDSVIWDMPGGGFAECSVLGKPAFVLWDERLIAAQPAARDLIDALIRVGVFCGDGASVASSCIAMYASPAHRYSPEQQETVDRFLDRFVRRNEQWPLEWRRWIATSLA